MRLPRGQGAYSATLALRIPARRATPIAHRFSAEFSVERCRMTWAGSYSAVRTPASPVFEIRPLTSVSPDWYFRGVRPNNGLTPLDDLNRPGSSIAEAKVSATIEPAPGTVVSSRARLSVRAARWTWLSSWLNCSASTVRACNNAAVITSSVRCSATRVRTRLSKLFGAVNLSRVAHLKQRLGHRSGSANKAA